MAAIEVQSIHRHPGPSALNDRQGKSGGGSALAKVSAIKTSEKSDFYNQNWVFHRT